MAGRNRFDSDWWTKERVQNGLALFVRDLFAGREQELPVNIHRYQTLIPDEERWAKTQDRLYPPAVAVMRHYATFGAAWWDLGYLVEVKTLNPKYVLTDEIKQRLYEIYEYRFKDKNRPKDLPGVKEYAKQIGLPEHMLTKWAVSLGLAHLKEPPWSDAEIDLLDQFGYQSPDNLTKVFKEHGFKRTKLGILLMRKRRMSHKATPYYSVNALAKMFNVDSHGVVAWIKKGWLKFIYKGTRRGQSENQNSGDTRLVHVDWIYDFIVKHPTEFQLRYVDQLWFLSIVTKGDVKLSYSDPSRISSRMECHQVDAPVEFTKSRIKQVLSEAEKGKSEGGLPYLKTGREFPHGTNSRYVSGKCRCAECADAARKYNRDLEERRKNGTSNPRVPADAARAHIEKLSEAGIGYLRVSRLAGVNHNIVWNIKRGERKNCSFQTEQKILGVTEDMVSEGTTIDAKETMGKVQELLNLGMSKSAIARRSGAKGPVLQIGPKLVMRKTARKIAEIYDDVMENGLPDDDRRNYSNGGPAGRPATLKSAAELAAKKPHGDRVKYMGGCRCAECRKANTDYEKKRSAERKAGRSNGLVPAQYAREHIQNLSEMGVGYKQVARVSGVSVSVIAKIRNGDRAQVRVSTETKIVGVTIEDLAGQAVVDARPTWERITWLLNHGWTKADIATSLGLESGKLQIGEQHCTRLTELSILEIFNEATQRRNGNGFEGIETEDGDPAASERNDHEEQGVPTLAGFVQGSQMQSAAVLR